jgi:hypothetical protein
VASQRASGALEVFRKAERERVESHAPTCSNHPTHAERLTRRCPESASSSSSPS